MKPTLTLLSLAAVVCSHLTTIHLHAQTTAFTYQGFLTENGAPANGASDFEFKLYNDPSAGAQQGSTVTLDDVGVTNGLFTVTLDFGNTPFTGQALWLNLAVRPGASAGAYTNLLPRQPITSTPYALKAANAMTVAMGTLSDPSFLGTTTTAPLQLQVSNTVGLRLEYPTAGTVPNLVGGNSGNSVGAGTEGAVIAGGGSIGGNENSIGVNSDYSAIGGGLNNNIAANSFYATIAGGINNDIGVNSGFSAIGGGVNNNIASNAFNATIAGGANNDIGVNAQNSAIGGGQDNNIASNSFYATIAGGSFNNVGVNADSSAIGGGFNNNIASNSFDATIAGGSFNNIGVSANYSAIGGGRQNNIASNAQYAVIPGGQLNAVGAGATYALAAGRQAKANHPGTFVWADSQNADFASTANNQFLIRAAGGVAIGTNDPAGAMLRVAGSIKADSYLGMGSTLMLGTTDNQPLQFKVNNQVGLRLEYPTVGSVPNLVGGFSGNSVGTGTEGAVIAGGGTSGGNENSIGVNSDYSAIGGGLNNNIANSSFYDTIAGGSANDIGVNAVYSAIGGGYDNNIASNSSSATIAGGAINDIGTSSDYSTIGGGLNNNISNSSFRATIAGGGFNNIGVDADDSAIGGGYDNNIAPNAQYAVIPGGRLNAVGAGATYALAAGRRAKANHPGAFVWADSTDADFASSANNQFLIRAAGGVGINSTAPNRPLTIRSTSDQWISLQNDSGATTWHLNGYAGAGFNIAQTGVADGRFFISTNGNVGINTVAPTARLSVGGTANNNTGVWGLFSDRRLKDHIEPMARGSLDQLLKLEGVTYEYTKPEMREGHEGIHRGWIAQQVEQVFPDWVSEAPDGMKMVTPVGFNALAVEALRELRAEKDAEIAKLKEKNAAMETRLAALEKLMQRLSMAQNGGGE